MPGVMEASHPATRLTEREKEVLRAWLDRKTAKEIAIDLGISHHAVEKRLKTARTKLGAGSSLAAARMLAEAEAETETEGYQQTVSGAPDLPPAPPAPPSRRYRPLLPGGIAMSLAIVLALALAPANQPATDAARPARTATVELDPDLEPVFEKLDADRSGYLESPESPFVTLAFVEVRGRTEDRGTAVLGDGTDLEQVAAFYRDADTDRDGRVSFREYYAWSNARLAELGIEVTSVLKVAPGG